MEPFYGAPLASCRGAVERPITRVTGCPDLGTDALLDLVDRNIGETLLVRPVDLEPDAVARGRRERAADASRSASENAVPLLSCGSTSNSHPLSAVVAKSPDDSDMTRSLGAECRAEP